MISINVVYQFVNENTRLRVIYIDYKADECIYVLLGSNTSMPIIGKLSELENDFANRLLIEILDPYFSMRSENNITEIEIEKRDVAWSIIEKYWESRKSELLSRRERNGIFEYISEEEGIPSISVKRIFSRFWQRGMCKNALIPDYSNSGGKGKNKQLLSKNGRRKVYQDGRSEDVIVTEEIKKQFEVATEKYWYDKSKKSLKEVYRLMLKDFYSINLNSKDGEEIQLLDRIPSYKQYYYWFKKKNDWEKGIVLRDGQKAFELKHRPIQSDSRSETTGPGFRYQIDSTVADLYIVSESDRNAIIGRPVVYIVIDIFSRLVTGVYVGIEASSWKGAMMALDSVVANKVEFCKQYGIHIEEGDWPCEHLPEIIIADRGEMEGYSANSLVHNLNISIENTAPYRGDYKGIVERFFRTMNEKIESFLPGAIMKEYRKRGDQDYRLDAKLTLKEITEIIIRCILLHNICEIEKYQLTTEMLKDNIKPTPLDIWNWGIANKKGSLRKVDRNVFRMSIMPRSKARLSRGAVVFKDLYYGATELIGELNELHRTTKSVEIVYDPRNVDMVYLVKGNGLEYVPLNLLERSGEHSGKCLEDILEERKKQLQLKQKARQTQLEHEIGFDNTVQKIAHSAKRQSDMMKDKDLSKAERVGNIRNNRKLELAEIRKEEAFTKATREVKAPNDPISFAPVSLSAEKTENLGDYNKRIMEKIRSRRRRENE